MSFLRDSARAGKIFNKAVKHWIVYRFQSFKNPKTKDKEGAKQLRLALEGLGPTFIKTGQLMSVRPDLIPPDYVFELENLQDTVAPMDISFVKDVIEKDLGKPVKEIFSSFDENPLASASIGQVHKAVLKEEGKTVAVKVMRPGIKKQIDADISLMKRIGRYYQKRVAFVDLSGVISEFQASLYREMDYLTEASHIKQFNENFKDDNIVVIPKVFDGYTTKRILTLEFIEGWKLSELEVPQSLGIDCFALAKHGAEAFIRQVLEYSFFHGDLHPANLLITPDGKVAYLDFGIVGTIPKEHRKVIAYLMMGIARQDVAQVVEQAAKIGVIIPRDSLAEIRPELRDILERYYGRTLGEVKIDIIGREFLNLIYKHHIRIPTNYALLAKALITIEGVAKKLYPEINILDIAQPFVRKLLEEKLTAQKTKEQLKKELEQVTLNLIDLPKQLNDVLGQLRSGKLTIRQKQEGLEPVQKSVLYAGVLIAMSVFFGASFLSFIAALIVNAQSWIIYLTGIASAFFFVLASYRCYSAFKS